MIRIDEIYNNTLWPWLQRNRPGQRMFFCDPFGRSDPESLFNYGTLDRDTNYIFFFDQEPVQFDIHKPTFDDLVRRNLDLPSATGTLVTSEKNSDEVKFVCETYNWQSLYYFFHGWAALDWYRGYDKTFVMQDFEDRKITRSFLAPNRIVAGKRNHRLLLGYHIFKNNLTENWISFPKDCPAENISVLNAVKPLEKIYPDISTVFNSQDLPINLPGETNHPMHSCWLSLFDQAADSLLYLVTETVASGKKLHITEKTFKPICLKMPFIIAGTMGTLEYLRSYGFKTFGTLWDESYDEIKDDVKRIEAIANVLTELNSLSQKEKQQLFNAAERIVYHNFNHFYYGDFERILWDELNLMLQSIK